MVFKNKKVWITGASSGIGEALEYAFAKEGAQLILSARNATELERFKSLTSRKIGNCNSQRKGTFGDLCEKICTTFIITHGSRCQNDIKKKRRKLLRINNLRRFVVMDGIEPPTHGFSVHCSTN